MKEYIIKATTIEDSLENWFWTNDDSIKGIVKISNPVNKKSIVLFKRTIDKNFIIFYNSKNTINIIEPNKTMIIINEYYREKLEIEKNKVSKLEINNASYFNRLFNSNWNHPNPSVSLSYKLSLISLLLGVIFGVASIILGFISLR